jgi:allantoicase
MIWQGKNHLHGSSIDTNAPVGNHSRMVHADAGLVEEGKVHADTGMVVTQKPLMLRWLKNHKDETLKAGRIDLIR